ncbi:hypothetical protein KDH_66440 [Dictyobacter sp. S3.2.2.5]|uniref:Type I restriction enzyme R protein N-terminal domain-containing protein n=1 Tax=Dictyobacter halimunensis TaxID=3026934 RepID=A0ABQ6G2U5_9CHLR|nr:hypothetical protein KDH_66440 [Dictyobacter sp. S3.2.2.5]
MSNTQFIEWVRSFNSNVLQNEDDVETKFILPLFKHLGYPDNHRRGKYSIQGYQPGKNKIGRKPEIDQIYFSTEEKNKQDKETSLILIEAKEPREKNLTDAIHQAEFYGHFLEPLLLFITNGQHIHVLKRHRFRDNEQVFNFSVQELWNDSIANDFYNQLHYEYIKHLKLETIDVLTHKLSIDLLNAYKRYPDLQNQLVKGDFTPQTREDRNSFVFIRPTVAITCTLPIAFEEGNCSIEFSNIMLRGLTCYLSHKDILMLFSPGLGTPPAQGERRFLRQTEGNWFEARLGQTTVLLSEREASELCDAIDGVFQRYKANIVKAANILEIHEYSTVSIQNMIGFPLFAVDRWLWNLMKLFTELFLYSPKKSPGYLFSSSGMEIQICNKARRDHTLIWPRVDTTDTSPSGNSGIQILYVDPITYHHTIYHDSWENTKDQSEEPSFEQVGPLGIWTAKYTEKWLLRQFIPVIFDTFLHQSHHSESILKPLQTILPPAIWARYKKSGLTAEQIKTTMESAIHDYHKEIYSPDEHKYVSADPFRDNYIPFESIKSPKELAPYIACIETMFTNHHAQLNTILSNILQPYYASLAQIIRREEPNPLGTEYMKSKLRYVQRLRQAKNIEEQPNDLLTHEKILDYLDQQVILINHMDYEDKRVAAMLSRILSVALKEGVFDLQQKHLNTLIEAFKPLYEQYCFEAQFVENLFYEE